MVLHVFISFLGGVPLCIPYGWYSGTLLGGTTRGILGGFPGRVLSAFVRAPPPGPLRRGVVPLIGYPPSSQGFISPPWAQTWDHELRYPFEVVPTTN